MPDLSMCTGETVEGFICRLRNTCYRHTAKPDMMQTYFSTPPMFNKNCEYYIEVKTHGKNERKADGHND